MASLNASLSFKILPSLAHTTNKAGIIGPESPTSLVANADLVAPPRVVKAANTLAAAVLASAPHEAGGQRVIFLSGDDLDAKAEVIALFENAGFFAIDLGALSAGGELHQVCGPLAGVNLVRLP